MNACLVFLILAAIFVCSGFSQKLCWGKQKSVIPTSGVVFFENFSSQKCMRVEALGILPNSNVVLNECLYRTKLSKDQEFQFANNALNKTTFRMDAGQGQFYCLSTSSSGVLKNAICNQKSFEQSWTVRPVAGHLGQFIIEQYSSKKCLRPKSRAVGSTIQLTPCNALITEQIWKLYFANSTDNPHVNADQVLPC